MKKILILFSAVLLAASCEWFELDNQAGYDAQVEGAFVDAVTGEAIQFGFPNAASFSIVEEGWDGESPQSWYVRPNGTYTNNLVFAGDYRIDTKDANFYPFVEKFTLRKGPNTHNFAVTPYARIIDPQISYDAAAGQLKATFKVEHADRTKTSKMAVAFCGYTDRFVSDGINNFTAKTAKMTTGVIADGQTEITLYVDVKNPTDNNGQFMYNRTHYVRIAAQATGAGVNASNRYNYSPVFAVSKDFSTITEITDWTEQK